MELSDPRLDKLVGLIRDSFRVRPNQDPIYVDIGGNLERVRSKQHQLVFGRRGSGKSCLLVHFHREVAPKEKIFTAYIDVDEIKRLSYPDLLLRILLELTEQLPGRRRNWLERLLRRPPSDLEAQARELRKLLDLADESDVTEESKHQAELGANVGAKQGPATAAVSAKQSESKGRTSKFREVKLDRIERHFQDYKRVLKDSLREAGCSHGAVIVDDFYLFDRSVQPDVVDYLHRLLRGTDLYLKLGTVRHRTTLSRVNGQTIGISPSEDVEEISLDRTFEDVAATQEFLEAMLGSMASSVGITSLDEFISSDGLLALTLASGGVPRDYLNILVDAIAAARALGQARVTPRSVYRGAGRLTYRTKLSNLRSDAGADSSTIERVYRDLAEFCLKGEKKTGFLVAQSEVNSHAREHEVIQQLMDFKLIHVIESDTSAASGRSGRFEAYTLDFALFMEPRLRGIRHIQFWRTDQQRRREGVREAPMYPLDRARDIMQATDEPPDPEALREEIAEAVGVEPDDDSVGGDNESD